MMQMTPPECPPLVAVSDDDGRRRLHFQLRQMVLTLLTVLATAWFVTLGPVPAILALVTAKHILVAILVMGLGVDKPRPERP